MTGDRPVKVTGRSMTGDRPVMGDRPVNWSVTGYPMNGPVKKLTGVVTG